MKTGEEKERKEGGRKRRRQRKGGKERAVSESVVQNSWNPWLRFIPVSQYIPISKVWEEIGEGE